MIRRMLALSGCVLAIATAPSAYAEPGDTIPYDRVPGVISGGPVPTMNGVPCVAGHLGTCIGFAQNQPAPRSPRASLGHSPTIVR